MLVLATGQVPNTAHWLVSDDPAPPVDAKKAAEPAEEGPKQKVEGSILKLAYRKGPDLPNLRHEFPDSHFICFPYETRRSGIYATGGVRRPMTMSSAKEDAAGAVMKAIQAMNLVSTGQAVHPRAGDLSFPEINLQRCTQCKRCTDECPFGALNEDEKGNPITQPTRCRRCGVCMGACPERIISFQNYSVDMIGSMIKEVEIPEEDEEKPRVLVLACENDAYPALDMAGAKGLKYSSYIRVVPLRCLGSMNLVWIADALSSGYDGVLLLGCRHGDDYQCHFIQGSQLAGIRMSKISETLTRLSLESERIRVEEVGITDWDRAPKIINEFMETIDRVGPNPFKDL
jgi:quinone-modifying oxidoreductase subunit QmoB